MKQGQFPAVFNLTNLNGQNGFKIDSETDEDYIGFSVSLSRDVNGDGVMDALISAENHNNSTGRTYLLFGNSEIGNTGFYNLTALNGTNGFKLDGEFSNDWSGHSVTNNGDFNRDGYADLLIGADSYLNNTGRTYVIYGGRNIGNQGLISLATINGTNGFKVDAETFGSVSGFSVGAGDVNGDQVSDILLSAPYYPSFYGNQKYGRSYVLFANATLGNTGLFNLTALNGTNGFKLDGESVNDRAGYALAGGGDLNGDGYTDLVLSSVYHNGNTGRVYVVWGGPNIGVKNGGLLPLASLNGTDGFKIDGESVGDNCGVSVSLGNFNGDAFTDLLIGAPNAYNKSGVSYLMFGSSNLGKDGVFSLTNLNGANGFKLMGESNSSAGFAVSMGDVNGDGYLDAIISASFFYYNNHTGRIYVLFGGPGVSKESLISLANMDGINGIKIDGEIFSSNTLTVTSGDINHDGIDDLLIGDIKTLGSSGRAYMMFGDSPPVMVNNHLVINQGQTVAVDKNSLLVTDANHPPAQIFFTIENLYHGEFLLNNNSILTPVTTFTQQDINSGKIYFQHDNTPARPSYTVAVNTTGIAYIPAQKPTIDFNANPILHSNTLCVAPGQTALVNTQVLKATQPGNRNENLLLFHISDLQHGYFSWVSAPAAAINSFYQYNISYHQVRFTHDSSAFPPAYRVAVTDGRIETNPASATVIFKAPLAVGQFPVTIELSALNGKNGFKIAGETTGHCLSGFSVGGVGDINGDGLSDVMTGSFPCSSSHVIFGTSHLNDSVINLNQLNGVNGFKLQGGAGEQVGLSLSAAGDINGDGYQDLLIGAPGNAPGKGYIVFGGTDPGQKNGSVLMLADLDGDNGFKLIGNGSDLAGEATGSLMDINRDGYDDLVIGAIFANSSIISTTGAGYIVWGGLTVGDSGVIFSSAFNGSNGVKMEGEKHGDFCGFSASGIGDINADGKLDIAIGAPYALSGAGRTYVLFGSENLQKSGLISLATLSGGNGFSLDGEMASDFSSNSIGALGDVNGDGVDDFVIGAATTLIVMGQPAQGGPGMSYVVFGNKTIGTSGALPLSSLNGVQGFKIKGEGATDNSGVSVRGAGDINGDGTPDILIGAWHSSPDNRTEAGRSYVVFGEPNLGKSGLLSLADMNGANGFKLAGELANDRSGAAVSGIGDFNGDGVADLMIGAPDAAGTFGISYVVFGDMPPLLINNELLINQNETVLLNTSHLLAIDANHNPDQLFFIISNLSHGQFFRTDNLNQSVTNFSQQQVMDHQIVFRHDGSAIAPSYKMGVNTSGLAFIPPQLASIDFDAQPVLLNNTLLIQPGETVLINNQTLSATHPGGQDNALEFIISAPQHGYFSWVDAPVTSILQFYQQNITDRRVQFSHDNSTMAPGYAVMVSDGRLTLAPAPAEVVFNLPVLLNNQLIINQGQTQVLTPGNLKATQMFAEDNQLIFIVSAVNQGYFSFTSDSGTPITRFNQQTIGDGQVQFIHDDSLEAPGYFVAVNDGELSTSPQAPQVDFDLKPVLVNNGLVIGQGQTVMLTPAQLKAMHNGVVDPDLRFIITNVTHAAFVLKPDTSPLTALNFTQQAIQNGNVFLIQDGGSESPAYQVVVTDGRAFTQPASANITFYQQPVFTVNQLFTGSPGASISLTGANICVNDCTDPVNDNIQLVVTGKPQYGQFEKCLLPGTMISSFFQEEIRSNSICFVTDGSTQAPVYTLTAIEPFLKLNSSTTGTTLLLTKNYWPINEGQIFSITLEALNISAGNGQSAQVVYTVIDSALKGGWFALKSTPNYLISSFKQEQVNNQQVVFVPNNSSTPPNAILTVNSGQLGGAQGSFTCKIDFATAPVLEHAFLKINQPDYVQLSPNNLQASDQRVPVEQLIFTVSDVINDHFANTTNYSKPIFNFTQQDVIRGNIYFIATGQNQPSFKVSVFNGRLSCFGCPKQADVFSLDAGSDESNKMIKGLLSMAVSVILIPVLRYGVEKAVKKYLSSRDNTLDSEMTAAVLGSLWIGVCGIITTARYEAYVKAVGSLVNGLEQEFKQDHLLHNLRHRWSDYDDDQKEEAKIMIAEGVSSQFVGHSNGCYRFFRSLCRPEVTPEELKPSASLVAEKIRTRSARLFQSQQDLARLNTNELHRDDSSTGINMGDNKLLSSSSPLLRGNS